MELTHKWKILELQQYIDDEAEADARVESAEERVRSAEARATQAEAELITLRACKTRRITGSGSAVRPICIDIDD